MADAVEPGGNRRPAGRMSERVWSLAAAIGFGVLIFFEFELAWLHQVAGSNALVVSDAVLLALVWNRRPSALETARLAAFCLVLGTAVLVGAGSPALHWIALSPLHGEGLDLDAALLIMTANGVQVASGYLILKAMDLDAICREGLSIRCLPPIAAAAFAAPVAGGVLAAAGLQFLAGQSYLQLLVSWASAHANGTVLVLCVAILGGRSPVRASLAALRNAEVVLFATVSSFTAVVAGDYFPYPFLAMLVPLQIAAMRVSPHAVALIGASMTVALTIATGFEKTYLHPDNTVLSHVGTQLALAVTFVIAVVFSLSLHDKRNEQAKIARRERRFRLFMEDSPIGMAIGDPDGRILEANGTLADILGYAGPDLLGLELAQFVVDEEAEEIACAAEAPGAELVRTATLERSLRRRDGSTVRVLIAETLVHHHATGEPEFRFYQVQDITDRKRAEELLHETEQRWLFALESAGQGVWDSDFKKGKFFVSDTWLQQLGLSDRSIAGDPSKRLALIHPDDFSLVLAAYSLHSVGDRDQFSCEYRMRHRDGHWVWIHDRGRILERDERGAPVRMIGTHTDVSARKEADVALQEAEERWKFALESGGQGVWDLDYRSNRCFYSPTFYKQLGLQPGALEGDVNAWRGLTHPDDLPRILAAFADHKAGLTDAMELECRMRHADGHWVWLLSRARIITRDEDGRSLRVIGTHTDISERKQAEEALREAETRWSFALDSSGQAVWDLDFAKRKAFYSPAWKAMLGYGVNEIPPEMDVWESLLHPDDRERILKADRDHKRGLTDYFSAEFRMRHKDGYWVWILDRGKVVARDADGNPLRMIGTHADISRRKKNEVELRDAKERAEAAVRAKSDFLANMSHELRTPLTSIIGGADLLMAELGSSLSENTRSILEMQREAGRGLLSLVNDILDFSRIEAGGLEIEAIPIFLAHLIKGCESTIIGPAAAKAISLSTDIAPDLPTTVLGDPLRLRQVLLNLLSNAVKFTPEGGSVRLSVESAPGGCVRFSVEDNGIGISDEEMGKLFQRFSQADTSTTRRYGGTGLGLAISKHLLNLMGGDVKVKSTPGVGSIFSFVVPLPEADAACVQPDAAMEQIRFDGLRVLLAEDNRMNQRLIGTMLGKVGCVVTIVSDGREAVDAVRAAVEEPFDIVLMDIQMPRMDGLEATSIIRHELQMATLPIIALTANVFADEVEGHRAVGVNGHAGKPIEWPQLLGMMKYLTVGRTGKGKALLQGRAAAAAAADGPAIQVLDPSKLSQMRTMFGDGEAETLVELFRDELADRLEAMEQATARPEQVAREAHALSSAAGSIGCEELHGLCRDIMDTVKRGEDYLPLLARLGQAAGKAKAALSGPPERMDEAGGGQPGAGSQDRAISASR